jgi:hypothetical protein
MENIQLLATPWWVNLVFLVPIGSYVVWRRKGLQLSRRQLVYAAIFGIAFGMNEAVVVVYLRAAFGLLGSTATAAQLLGQLSGFFIATEVSREAATIIILIAVSMLTVRSFRERWALFLWMFAFWDIFYYVGLWLIIRWPPSLLAPDVLFLIPTPWIAQVWFPVLVSLLAIGAVALATQAPGPHGPQSCER